MKTITEILKINWFYKKWNIYDRDDWIQIYNWNEKWVAFWNWEVCNFKNSHELIWFLVLRWIINRLF